MKEALRKRIFNEDGSVRPLQQGAVFMWINGKPYNMEELGDIAQMPIIEGLQAMMDRGLMGEWPPGYTIYHYMQEHGSQDIFRMLGLEDSDSDMTEDAWERLQSYEDELAEQIRMGQPISDEQRLELEQRMRDFQMMKKLSSQ